MHEVYAKSILSASNGMNLYRGCTHGCIYCDSRSTCYQILHDFEDVEVKVNAPELLEQALRRKRRRCMIGTGSMSDPYLPLERELRLTRRCLEIIERYGFGVALLTKSDLVLRDLDLLKRIHARAKCVVQMTLTTADPKLCRIVEPKVCDTIRRVEVLEVLRDAGIPTVVWMTPILPFINDTEENIRGLMEMCVRAKVRGIITFQGLGLTLRDGDRQFYYANLDRWFPGLSERYRRVYGNAYELTSRNSAQLMEILKGICQENGIWWDIQQIFGYMNAYEERMSGEQLSLFED
jgi:DNA repair photolyase